MEVSTGLILVIFFLLWVIISNGEGELAVGYGSKPDKKEQAKIKGSKDESKPTN